MGHDPRRGASGTRSGRVRGWAQAGDGDPEGAGRGRRRRMGLPHREPYTRRCARPAGGVMSFAIYERVSEVGEREGESFGSPEVQEAAARDWADREGADVY